MAQRKAKRTIGTFTPEQKKRWEASRDSAEQDKAELMALGTKVKERHQDSVAQILSELSRVKEAECLSLADLMERTGIDRGSLSKFLNGSENPTLKTLNRIAVAMGYSVSVSLEKIEQ